nr:hypothetical protein CFP56_72050 [Quercus suber]
MRVIEYTEILFLGRIRRPDLPRLHFQFCLSQASSLNKDLICGGGRRLAPSALKVLGLRDKLPGANATRTLRRSLNFQKRIALFGQLARGIHRDIWGMWKDMLMRARGERSGDTVEFSCIAEAEVGE